MSSRMDTMPRDKGEYKIRPYVNKLRFREGRFGVVKLSQIMLIVEIASANASISV